MHARLFPAKNAFRYPIYYLSLDVDSLSTAGMGRLLGIERFGLMGFYVKDHGDRKGTSLRSWINDILKTAGLEAAHVRLVCLPRILGYVFNPVSFWFCYDRAMNPVAVLCEVNNTFGETHSYLCPWPDAIQAGEDAWVEAEKVFHVSPFLPREGGYKFRFKASEERMAVQIDFHAGDGQKQLITTLSGHFGPLTGANWARAFFLYPFVTFGAVFLIHWQAVKLWFKKQKFFSKPPQKNIKISHAGNIKKS
jgi:uncharacterized protein